MNEPNLAETEPDAHRERVIEALRHAVRGRTRHEIVTILGAFSRESRRQEIDPKPIIIAVTGREVFEPKDDQL